MLRDIDAVIFDLDGTLVDSMWIWKDIDIEYLGRFGLSLPDDLQYEIEGMSFTETAIYFQNRFRLPCTLDEIKQTWYDMAYNKYLNEVPLKPGAGRFLHLLNEKRIKLGIATSNGIELVKAVSKAHGFQHFFSSIRTGCDVAKGKPAPDIYLKVAEDLHVPPKNCLVFEDVPMGIMAGKSAGMKVCAVKDAFSESQMEQKRNLADYFIDNYDAIIDNTYEVLEHET